MQVRQIAMACGVDAMVLVDLNAAKFPDLRPSSKLHQNTKLLVPVKEGPPPPPVKQRPEVTLNTAPVEPGMEAVAPATAPVEPCAGAEAAAAEAACRTRVAASAATIAHMETRHKRRGADAPASAPASAPAHETREAKHARLLKMTLAYHEALNTTPARPWPGTVGGSAHPEGAHEFADGWWWIFRTDVIPPPADATLCAKGTVAYGRDGRQWRVMRSPTQPQADRRLRWVPLAEDGTLLRPSQLPPQPPAFIPHVGRPERLSGRPPDRSADLGNDLDEGGGSRQHVPVGAVVGGGSRHHGSRDENAYRYEVPPSLVNFKLWPGAAAAGWRMIEAYKGARTVANWTYLEPNGTKHRTRQSALEAAAAAGVDTNPDSWVYPRVRLVSRALE